MGDKKNPGALLEAAGAVSRSWKGPDAANIGQRGAKRQNPEFHETADWYGLVLSASGCWRVVRCQADLQFIVQRRVGGGSRFPWRGIAYLVAQSALPAVLHRPSLGIPADVRADLLAQLGGEG